MRIKPAEKHLRIEFPNEYETWRNMLANVEYRRYKRNVPIDAKWKQSFKAFLADMGEKPDEDSYLRRKKRLKGFNKENCFWSTNSEKHEYDGQLLTVKEIAKTVGMPYSTLKMRLHNGWSLEQAVTTPIRPRKKNAA